MSFNKDVDQFQLRQFAPARAASQKNGQHGPVPRFLQSLRIRKLPKISRLIFGEPIAEANLELLRALDTADASS